MQQQLVIRLHAAALHQPSWALVDKQGEISDQVLSGDATALPALSKDREVIVIVPGEEVLLTTVILPKMNRSRVVQAIPYALEEQIIEDVDSLHFAAGNYAADQPLSVMVVAKSKMQQWLDLLKSWQVTPNVLIPDMLTLPLTEHDWYVFINDMAIVRTGQRGGFTCDTINLSEMLVLALSGTTLPPHQILLKSTMAFSLPQALSVSVDFAMLDAKEQLVSMAKQASRATENLLQGDYQVKNRRGLPKLNTLTKSAAYLFIFWLFLLFLYPVVSFVILDQRATEVKTQMMAIYKRHFPSATSMVTPKDRLQQKLNKLASGVGDNQFLQMLANIGKGLAEAPGVQIKRLDYQGNALTLQMTAQSSEVFAQFTDALSRQGLRVKQENATLNGTHVSAALQIE